MSTEVNRNKCNEFLPSEISYSNQLVSEESNLIGRKRPFGSTTPPQEGSPFTSQDLSKKVRPVQIRNRKFVPFEDERIIQYVTECGGECTHVQWLWLDEELGRQNLSVKLRWMNVLKPRLRAALAEQSGAILLGLANGEGPQITADLPSKALITTLQYKRHTFSAEENERIFEFSRVRMVCNPPTPWTRIDQELGRSVGACKHRFESLVLRSVKETMKDILDEIEESNPSPTPTPLAEKATRSKRRKSLLSEDAPKTEEMKLELSRATEFSPAEDALIFKTVNECPGKCMTTVRWRALSEQMNRAESWLRYRWAILARREEKAAAMRVTFSTLLCAIPVSESITGDVLSVIDALLGAVCDVDQRFSASTRRGTSSPVAPGAVYSKNQTKVNQHVTREVVSLNPKPASSAKSVVTPEPQLRAHTRVELMHIVVQMAKCQEVGEEVWQSASSQLYPTDAVRSFWKLHKERPDLVSSSCVFNTSQQAFIVQVVEEHLTRQKEQVWKTLAFDLCMTPEQVQNVWSQLWFAVHFPAQYPGGFVTQMAPSPFFSPLNNSVIIRRMRSCPHESRIACWLSDLALFLCKPVGWVAAQWGKLHTQLIHFEQRRITALH